MSLFGSRFGLVLALWVVCFAVPAQAQAAPQYIYWSNTTLNTIGRANIDGTGINQSFVSGLTNPRGIAVSPTHIYWAKDSSIGRANLDGTGVDESFITGTGSATAVAVSGTHIYWSRENTTTVGRAAIDGTNPDNSFINVATNPWGVFVAGGYVYWANYASGGASSSIGRANLDGSGIDNGYVDSTDGSSGVAVDGSYIYWSSWDDNTMGRANIDGTGTDNAFIVGHSAGARQVAVSDSRLYWVNSAYHVIVRSNINGTGAADFIGSDFFAQPQGVAISATYPVFSVDPQLKDFGTVEIGSTSTVATFTVENTGDAPLDIGQVQLTGSDSGQYSIDTTSCANAQLAPAGACTAQVSFSPSQAGATSANLQFAHNASGLSTSVSLSGVGEAPPTPTNSVPTGATTAVPEVQATTEAAASQSSQQQSASTPTALTKPLEPIVVAARRPGELGCVVVKSSTRSFRVSYRLSEASQSVKATLLFKPRAVQNRENCRPARRWVKKDIRFKSVRTIKTAGSSGANYLSIPMASGKSRLSPGRYRLRIQVTAPDGGKSVPSGRNFLMVVG